MAYSIKKNVYYKYQNLITYLRRIIKNGHIRRLTRSQRLAILNRWSQLKKSLGRYVAIGSLSAAILFLSSELIGQCDDRTLSAPIVNFRFGGTHVAGIGAAIAYGDVNDDSGEDFIALSRDFIQYYGTLPSGSGELQFSANNNPFNSIRMNGLWEDIFLSDLFITSPAPELIRGKSDGTLDVYEMGLGGNHAASSSNPFNGIDVGSYASPWLGNFDGDIDKDAFIGNLDGEILYFEIESGQFVERTGSNNPFNLVDVGLRARPFLFSRSGREQVDAAVVGTNDGQLKYFELNPAGTQFEEIIAGFSPFASIDVGAHADPCMRDLDDDGDLDLIVGNQAGTLYSFINDGGYTMTNNTTDILHDVEVGYLTFASPDFFDWDDDGDDDLFLGLNDGTITYLENVGGNFQVNTADNPFAGWDYGGRVALKFAELFDTGSGVGFTEVIITANDRFDIGFFVRNHLGKVIYSGSFPISTAIGTNPYPTVTDIDSDGDQDIFIGNTAGNILAFEHTGTHIVQRTGSQNPFDGISVPDHAAPEILDLDGDIYKDALVGYNGGFKYYEYNGFNAFIEKPMENPLANLDIPFAKPRLGKLAHDGQLEIVIGSDAGHLIYLQSNGNDNCYQVPCSYQNNFIGPATYWNLNPWDWSSFEIPTSCTPVNIPSGKTVMINIATDAKCANLKVQSGAIFEIFGTLTSQL